MKKSNIDSYIQINNINKYFSYLNVYWLAIFFTAEYSISEGKYITLLRVSLAIIIAGPSKNILMTMKRVDLLHVQIVCWQS